MKFGEEKTFFSPNINEVLGIESFIGGFNASCEYLCRHEK